MDSGMPPEVAPEPGRVSVIVIGYNDAAHIRAAVLSALEQGPVVREVIAVDDASTDGTGVLLDRLATRHPRLTVRHRTVNSGGCGSPRNDGLRQATAPYVMFLDSDDVLPPGAVAALLAAAGRHSAPVVAGACVRRELPRRRDTRWQRALYLGEAVHDSPELQPRLVRDTLCVNKLYDRAFLAAHEITFPEGPFRYEDFVFTARVLAAGPRIAVIPDTVYIWHVRRDAARPSISLDRQRVDGWRARLAAHRLAVDTLELAGRRRLAHAARVKFLDHDLRMYLRELGRRDEEHRAAWWHLTQDYLETFGEEDLLAARAPARWIARVVSTTDWPRDLERLAGLAVHPARLLPPYTRVNGVPVWAVDLPSVPLDRVDEAPLHRLPVTVDGALRANSRSPGPRLRDRGGRLDPAGPGGGRGTGGTGATRLRLVLALRVHELYGRLTAAGGPVSVDVELRHRDDGRLGLTRSALLTRDDTPTPSWTAELLLHLGERASGASFAGGDPDGAPEVWDVRVRVRCADGGSVYTGVRAVGPLPRRRLVAGRGGLLLVHPGAAAGGSLVLRVSQGPRGALRVAGRALRRGLPGRR
ncbi:glycosyltransferase family 2 protein [Streptomyces zingiberis]|uniref:Glycosyltransferase family 2 protein n=1 Tax=Streptomyces zingiberis TaxID=2053010 RepID=A0ABX1C1D0_9ACTN|nr:glycosyltransferase family 2 protein [Streptomyces zingiberis]NJQ01762.1 glycosyltransferase family 2 protein [Streptomyces zingiberis]